MNRIKVFGIWYLVVTVFFVSICAVLSLFSPAWADECTSTVTPDFKVHIPSVQFDTGLYSLDLQYAPSSDGTIWFDIVGAGVVDTLSCDNPAYLFPASGAYYLYVPSIGVGADKYWVTMQYMTGNTSTREGLAVTNFNGENIIPPPGTLRVPKSMKFASTIIIDQGPGGWKMTIPMKSDTIHLVEDPLAPLTSPGFSFKAASGFLYVGDDASCSYNQIPDFTATCHLDGAGIGLFFIDALTITDVNSSSPQITMLYHLSFPPNQLVMNSQLCYRGDCHDLEPEDVSSAGPNVYEGLLRKATDPPMSLSATEWKIIPGTGFPCNGCGWPYAEKVYPDITVTFGPGTWKVLRPHIVLYE